MVPCANRFKSTAKGIPICKKAIHLECIIRHDLGDPFDENFFCSHCRHCCPIASSCYKYDSYNKRVLNKPRIHALKVDEMECNTCNEEEDKVHTSSQNIDTQLNTPQQTSPDRMNILEFPCFRISCRLLDVTLNSTENISKRKCRVVSAPAGMEMGNNSRMKNCSASIILSCLHMNSKFISSFLNPNYSVTTF